MVVGDRAKDVIVHLHYIMSSVDIKQNKSVLWAYKKDLLGFTRLADSFSFTRRAIADSSLALVIERSGKTKSRRR